MCVSIDSPTITNAPLSTLLQDPESVGQEGGPREFTTLTVQFCCEPKTAVKKKSIKKKQGNGMYQSSYALS